MFRAYGIPHEQWRNFTIDVPLSLGGAPEAIRNVWPERKAEASARTRLRTRCTKLRSTWHTLTLAAAQAAIARNWTQTPNELPAIREHHYAEDER